MAVYGTGAVHIDKAISGKKRTGATIPIKASVKKTATKKVSKKQK